MAPTYAYGTSPLHKYPIPLDGTPIDGVSWTKLVDPLGLAIPTEVASQAEQDAYLQAVTGAGLAPTANRIVRVCRTDLDGLVMRHDGTGWTRDMGGSWTRTGSVNATSAVEPANTRASRGAISFDHPFRSLIRFEGDVTAILPAAGVWAFYIWIEDSTGREIPGTSRMYSNLPGSIRTVSAETRGVADMPAGAGQLKLMTLVSGGSQGIQFSNVGVTAAFA